MVCVSYLRVTTRQNRLFKQKNEHFDRSLGKHNHSGTIDGIIRQENHFIGWGKKKILHLRREKDVGKLNIL